MKSKSNLNQTWNRKRHGDKIELENDGDHVVTRDEHESWNRKRKSNGIERESEERKFYYLELQSKEKAGRRAKDVASSRIKLLEGESMNTKLKKF